MAGDVADPARIIRLAVLPFANLTGNPDQEYLSDGVTPELITQLGRLHPGGLGVIARTRSWATRSPTRRSTRSAAS